MLHNLKCKRSPHAAPLLCASPHPLAMVCFPRASWPHQLPRIRPKALHYAACSNWSENVTPTPNPIRHHTLPARVEPAHTRRPSRRPSQTAELPPHNRTASQWGSSVALEALIQGSFAGKRDVGPRAADKPQPLFSAREAETLNPKPLTLNPKHEPPEALSSPLSLPCICGGGSGLEVRSLRFGIRGVGV